jgi:hypothetical protein
MYVAQPISGSDDFEYPHFVVAESAIDIILCDDCLEKLVHEAQCFQCLEVAAGKDFEKNFRWKSRKTHACTNILHYQDQNAKT